MAAMGGCLRLAAALHTALIVFAWCMIGLWLCCLYALSANDKVAEELAPMNIRYTYGSALKLDKRNLFVGSPKVLINSLFFFGPPLLAAIAVTLASMLPIGAPMFVRTKAQRCIGGFLGWQVPDRRFFMWWCGGLSVGEMIFFLGFLAAIASRLYTLQSEVYDEWHAIDQVLVLKTSEREKEILEQWGKHIGEALCICFWCLFWPVSHDSWLNHVLGIPWQNMIKYHRWMGHITVWMITVHGACYAAFAVMQQHEDPTMKAGHYIFEWEDSHPHLAGVLAWVGAMALQITSIHYIRRRWFAVFYRVHVLSFMVLVVLASAHYNRVWLWIFPGLMPWAVDLVFRFAQGSSITTITSAHLSDDHSVATLQLSLDEGLEVHPLHDYMLNVPCISRWEWHPFTCAGKRASLRDNTVTFNIKKYGTFTETLFKLLERGAHVPVRVQGPIGLRHAEYPWLKYNVLVAFVGGIGISPVLSMLRGLVDARSSAVKGNGKGAAAAGPARVIMVWAARHKAEFTILDESVLAAATEKDSWLSVGLHYTGSHMERASSVKHLPGASAAKLADSDSSDTASQTSSGNDMKGVARGIGGGCPLGLDALRFPWASPLGFSLARPVQPKVGSAWQMIAAIILAHLGGFCAVALSSVYNAEGQATGRFDKKMKTFFNYNNGFLAIFGAFIGAIGLPVFAIHTWAAWRYFRAARDARSVQPVGAGVEAPLSPREEAVAMRKFGSSHFKHADVQPTTRYASSLIGGRVGMPDAGCMLDIVPHRPDIRAILAEASAKAGDMGGGDVGVYVAGPQGMVKGVKRLVADVNDNRAKHAPCLHFHQETWEL